MNGLDDYTIQNDLPESLARENAQEIAQVVDKVFHQYNTIIPRVLIYPVIDTLPSELVDTLAVQLHCDFYDYTLPLERKREIVKQSIAWHRIKGTRGAVELAVRAVFGEVKVEEWYEYGGRPYTFRITVEGADAFDENHGIDLLMKVINASKNVRSWLEGEDGDSGITIHYEVSLSDEDAIRYGFASIIDGQAKLSLETPPDTVLRYLAEAITGGSGHRTVGSGPSELTAQLAHLLATVNIRAGTGEIPYNPEDIPEGTRRITLPARISEKLGFAYGLVGRRNTLLARPEPGLVTPAPIVLAGLAGLRQYGLAPPEDGFAKVLLGNVLAKTGHRLAEAASEDIPPGQKEILEDAILTPYMATKALKSGTTTVHGMRPEDSDISLRVCMAGTGGGRKSISVDPDDLPDYDKDFLKSSTVVPVFGAKALPVGSRRITPAIPSEGEQVLFMGMATGAGGRVRISTAFPDGSWCRIFIGGTQAITGRVTVGADKGDLPPRRHMGAHVGIMQAGLSAVG